jgi:hypothetical protein
MEMKIEKRSARMSGSRALQTRYGPVVGLDCSQPTWVFRNSMVVCSALHIRGTVQSIPLPTKLLLCNAAEHLE